MIKIITLIILFSSLLFSNTYFNSSYGSFINDISDNWLIQTKNNSINNEQEILFYKKNNENFNNNIIVIADKNPFTLDIKKKILCNKDNFQNNLQEAFNRKDVKVYSCENTKINNRDFIVYEHDGLIESTKNIGYIFRVKDYMIRMILACDKKYCNQIKNEFIEILAKIEPYSDLKMVDKERLINKQNLIKSYLPIALCKEKSYFRSCYKINETECSQLSENYVTQCINTINVNFNNEENYNNMGQIIGMCAGSKFEEEQKKRLNKTKDCLNWQNN